MRLSLSGKVVGALAGAVAMGGFGTVFGLIAPALISSSMANEPKVVAALQPLMPPATGKALDTNLAKFNGDYFAIGTEPGIVMTPDAVTQIKKIGYGETRFVTVSTTPSGTYSSDGLASPYIRYPGVHVERMQLAALPFGGIYGWSTLTGWTKIPLFSANSIGFLDEDKMPASQDGVCVADTDMGGCR